ncbi:glutathione S-transferase family protein [Sphingosinicella terrae]|uniref:glutathione S-transferase family protein n=1 Tax=Sphingosinicella terrae TaxID=2172047 RepID=UPI000E0D940E|nr:glutathione S-transferase family protein [Sphingosinicella terrae]
MHLKLFFAPGACSRVSLIALEELGVDYETHLVAFMKGEHRSPDYLAMNPAGKVPLLVADGRPVAQNAAILTFLARAFPEAGLLPFGGNPFEEARILSQLVWCASDLHPIVTRIRLPFFFCDLPGGPEQVRAKAEEAMRAQLAPAEALLGRQPWLLGENFSAVDAYFYWVWFRITGAGFDSAAYPNIGAHYRRMESRTSVQRVIAREAEAEAELDSRGLAFKIPVPPAPTA